MSPYGFKTAQAHYEALLEETRRRGGPTQHTYATVPGEWTGRYMRPSGTPGNQYWFRTRHVQVSTILSLLTAEYQTRMVQEAYHHGNTNKAMWPSQFCWPEGFMRRWHEAAVREHQIMVTPAMVQILAGVAQNFITDIHIGRQFNTEGAVPRLGPDVPRWYGETIGFWDKDTLITWTSNIQGWKTHAAFEHSNKMQTIEIYTPNRDASGKFLGLNHEAIFYDPEALVEPVRIVRNLVKTSGFEQGDPYVFIECLQTIYPVDGTATPVSPGQVIQYEVPDMLGRPWADIWEKYWEKGMEKPQEKDIFSFNDLRAGGAGTAGEAGEDQMSAQSRIGGRFAVAIAATVVLAASVRAHHSFAMYDTKITKVFTGVVTRIDPSVNHLQIFFAPMNAERKNVERDRGRPADRLERRDGRLGTDGQGRRLGELVPARHGLQRRPAPAAQRPAGREPRRRHVQVPRQDAPRARDALRFGQGTYSHRQRAAAQADGMRGRVSVLYGDPSPVPATGWT